MSFVGRFFPFLWLLVRLRAVVSGTFAICASFVRRERVLLRCVAWQAACLIELWLESYKCNLLILWRRGLLRKAEPSWLHFGGGTFSNQCLFELNLLVKELDVAFFLTQHEPDIKALTLSASDSFRLTTWSCDSLSSFSIDTFVLRSSCSAFFRTFTFCFSSFNASFSGFFVSLVDALEELDSDCSI